MRANACVNGREGEQGVALLLVVLFVALLSVIVTEYCYESQVDASVADAYLSDLEAYVAAKSAINSGLALLAADIFATEELGIEMSGAEFDCFEDVWAQGMPPQPINEAVMRCAISDEYGKINLNALIRVTPEGQVRENPLLINALDLLFQLRGFEVPPTDAILDWLDPDNEPRQNGAEADYYGSLEMPYPCRNGPMTSLEELLLLPGIPPVAYYGIPEEGQIPLTELLTVHGDPRGRVNINTAPLEVLDAVFEAWNRADPAQTEFILQAREEGQAFISLEQLEGLFGEARDNDISTEEVLTVAGQRFRLYGYGMEGDTLVRIEAYVWRNSGGRVAPPVRRNNQRFINRPAEAAEAFRILEWRVMR